MAGQQIQAPMSGVLQWYVDRLQESEHERAVAEVGYHSLAEENATLRAEVERLRTEAEQPAEENADDVGAEA